MIRRLSVLLSCLILSAGCSEVERPEGLPELYPMTLQVEQSGDPLVGASVQLFPSDGTPGEWVIGGSTNARGEAVLMTHGRFEGAPAGNYKVTVNKSVTTGQSESDDPNIQSDVKIYDLVERKFRSVSTTPIEVEVTAGNNAPQTIDVGSAVKEAAPEL